LEAASVKEFRPKLYRAKLSVTNLPERPSFEEREIRSVRVSQPY